METFVLFELAESKTPLSTPEIIDKLEESMANILAERDLEKSERGIPRWQNNARFAIYQGLSKRGLVHSVGKSRWEITEIGKDAVGKIQVIRRGPGRLSQSKRRKQASITTAAPNSRANMAKM